MSSDWKTEIVECGDLVQDDDEFTPPEEAARRWNRYVQLADSVTGKEGAEGVAAIVSSLRAEEDYGAYQAAHAALSRFPPVDLGKGVALAASELVSIPKDGSGNVLLILARSGSVAVNSFNETIRASHSSIQGDMRALVEFHEEEEWLSDEAVRNVLLTPRG
ncbi:hypothetical protein M2163_005876 [Streptomyces sp. SAI-135]|jgi:hypothetical protein|uniref:hypothetical protein n=1 Tax=unclassified Streptomyces TaxID=2593676 RepID=UPI0024737EBC|nr:MULTISPECIES: hypothetical protein [unclassified Streptomyces]MDH6517143.1 hypothetical protein [Streptomyces sp. SAI-090]MDH6549357.1 hypothetical protein [Streptomyces sp. SAI-041]MDH6568422.1 hypothetical protein [Streptomyces sp. SAI-117]MDH6586629.1 hypothetical protein [Streptomyces sp. SAI-133]MDH6618768.1 hypothetical protein [Streptomyces sp. SAI-135]